jgi:hypothetical protein
MDGADTQIDRDVRLEAREIIESLRQAVIAGEEHWFLALLEAIRRWPLAEEQRGERTYRYLVGGEAFDWLLLAERLCEEIEGLVPQGEVEDLLFHGRFPLDMTEAEFRRFLGAKQRPQLNFEYGVRVETALQLAVQQEVSKEMLTRIWENGHVDEEAFSRIYGKTRPELLKAFWMERSEPPSDAISLADLTEFTYWLFRYRVANCDPAKVASDTRKGVSLLARLEARRLYGPPGSVRDGGGED